MVDPKDLRAFAHRDWAAADAAKRARAAETFRREGPARLLRAARALFEHARIVNPGWPPARDRSADLEHHVKVKGWLDRASDVRRR
jgi:hypothetical protein